MAHTLSLFLIICIGFTMSAQQHRTILHNAKVYTVNEEQPLTEAVVIEGNKILFTGSNSEAMQFRTGTTDMLDLNGKLVLPGLIDNHVHFINGGFYLNGINLRPAKTVHEFISILGSYISQYPGQWVTGGDWDHEAWDQKVEPRKEWIDSVSGSTPVFVNRFDGHMGVANSEALRRANITKDTPDPDGGKIVKDPVTGEPTGVLKDNAMSLVYSIIPTPGEAEYDAALRSALNEAKRLGITSVQDITYYNDLATYRRAKENKQLTCRIYGRTPIDSFHDMVEQGVTAGSGDEYIKLGSLKAFTDGSLGSATAWFFDPYVQDTSTCGLAMDIVSDGRLERWGIDADSKRLQLSIHAIGDRANSWCLDLFSKITKENPQWDRRFRIEHAQHLRKEDISRMKQLNVVASVQPYHAIDDGVWAEKRIGKERLRYTYPFRSLIDAGVKVSFGTDWSVAPLNPMLGIYAAVTRRTLDGKNPNGWIPEEKISVEEAVKCYTLNSAYGAFEENIKGSIEPGKLADLVVLSDDIFSIDPEKIKDVHVLMTIFDGVVIYSLH